MLIDPSKRISEIGFAVGFRSIPRFNALFKLHVGMAPRDFRDALIAVMPDFAKPPLPG
jgi:AraC-like DNA-binding protein